MDWIIDISIYQSLTVNELLTLKANGLGGVIIKASQGVRTDADLDYNVNNLKQVGIPYALYHWADPTVTASSQVDHFMGLTNQYRPNFIVHDMEQYWSNWAQWYAKYVQHQDITLDKFSHSYLYNFYNDVFDKTNQRTELPLLIYSANWFINDYCEKLPQVIAKAYGYWNARYYNWVDANKNKKMSFDELHVFVNSFSEAKLNSMLPPNVKDWMIWQVNVVPIEDIEKLDLDIIRPQDCAILFNQVPKPEPEPEPEPEPTPSSLTAVVLVNELRIREKPSNASTVKILGLVKKGDEFPVLDVSGSNSWIKVNADGIEGWIAVQIASKEYCSVV